MVSFDLLFGFLFRDQLSSSVSDDVDSATVRRRLLLATLDFDEQQMETSVRMASAYLSSFNPDFRFDSIFLLENKCVYFVCDFFC